MSTTSVGHVAPSVTSFPELTSQGTAISTPPRGGKKKLFSDILSGRNPERHRLTVKPNDNKTAEEIKNLLRTEIDPVNMIIGIRTFKSLKNGNVLIEADNKEEIELINTQIPVKCEDHVQANVHKKEIQD